MMITLCLLLKPEVTTADGRESQRGDIETFIKPAIRQAGLSALDDRFDGQEAYDISDDLIQKVHEAHVLIIDANCYETTGLFRLSPYLYYYIALAHSLGNRTILLTKDSAHLPHNLIKYHTLTYSLADIWKFIDRFKAVIEEIQQQQNNRPDNPIQDYRVQKEYAEARKRIVATEAEMEALKTQQKQGNQRSASIVFRKIDKEGWQQQ